MSAAEVYPVERDIRLRCVSEDIEAPERTHACKLTATHSNKHRCICGRTWGGKP